MNQLIKWIILTGIGGLEYFTLELIFRGRSHWSMIIVGGLCFFLVGCLNNYLSWDMSIILQSIIGGIIITSIEFISGYILNIILQWNIWDYSDIPGNIKGQICLPFSILWVLLAAVAIVQDDYLRYWIFKEEKPHYKLFGGKKK